MARAFNRGHAEAMKRQQMAYLTSLGYKSAPFRAIYKGGKCGLSGLKITPGDEVAYFRDFGLCHTAPIGQFLQAEADAKKPKCGCGRVADWDDNGCRICH